MKSTIGEIETTAYQLRREGVALDSDTVAVNTNDRNPVEGKQHTLVRVHEGARSFSKFVEEELSQSNASALQNYVNGPVFLDKLRPLKKQEGKDARDFTVAVGLRSKLADPEDYDSEAAVVSALIAEYAYLTGKNANPTRKAELEAVFEWQQLVNQEYRDYKVEIDNANNRGELDAITFDYTPAP